jgi:hypothetical protein
MVHCEQIKMSWWCIHLDQRVAATSSGATAAGEDLANQSVSHALRVRDSMGACLHAVGMRPQTSIQTFTLRCRTPAPLDGGNFNCRGG